MGYGDWRDDYKSRLRGIDDAMARIERDDLVALTILAPPALSEGLLKRGKELGSLNVRFLAPSELPLLDLATFEGEREIEIFIGDAARPSHDAHISTYLPQTFMLGMKAHDSGREEARMPDVFLTVCSEPNESGYVHFGPHMWLRKSYTRRCKRTIAVVDPSIIPVHGDVFVHVSEIDTFVEGVVRLPDYATIDHRIETETPEADRERMRRLRKLIIPEVMTRLQDVFPLTPPALLEAQFKFGVVDPEAQSIADHLRQILRDGDTIQVGVGEPSQLMFNAGAFEDVEHIGLHTELGSPGLAKLWARGILDNSLKTLHKGRAVAVAWSGCDGEDMALIQNNPVFQLFEPNDLLHPAVMSQNHQMTSINSAVAVDLLGQIASEDRFGGNMINGTGGQPDTHISAALCRNGRAITVLRSTAVSGSISKIVAQHDAGTLVTIPRYLADTVITEHGVARLLDKNHRQRVDELVSVAHPDFRAELRKQAAGLWLRS